MSHPPFQVKKVAKPDAFNGESNVSATGISSEETVSPEVRGRLSRIF